MFQKRIHAGNLAFVSLILMMACVGAALGPRGNAIANEDQQAAAAAGRDVGPSGLPVPRFVSLKSDKVNVRRGPSSEHQVAWVYERRSLPVEIIAEFENWRRIRDSDGEEGWVYHSLLSSTRTAVVSPWKHGTSALLYQQPNNGSRAVAKVESGVLANVSRCSGTWCQLEISGYSGWLEQNTLWGVYPGERIDP
ncbi:SH3-like domain-containing protein [Rhodoligotrophos appendicifer]|uniref:SH3 domain-containing protein n=1 Tax=Rhodoligotrophos appendicifer TaxID=987056 RepID=UPI0019605599|nr:SH3 domain-containing protein [Rhodoligotrophos appendicifer]